MPRDEHPSSSEQTCEGHTHVTMLLVLRGGSRLGEMLVFEDEDDAIIRAEQEMHVADCVFGREEFVFLN